MHAELLFSLSTLYSFLLVLTRVGGIVVFIPIPGVRAGSAMSRVVLAAVLTLALFPAWPAPPTASPTFALVAGWMLSEAAFGITAGLAVSFLLEGFQLAAQVLGLQAGYSYSTMIDPNSDADSGVLQITAMLFSSLFFLALGLDRVVISIVARSLQAVPPGTFLLNRPMADAMIHLGANMFVLALRLAMPVLALLLLIDVALALLSRIQAQLQLLTLAFPAKMLAALVLLGLLAPVFPRLTEAAAAKTFQTLAQVFGV